MANCIMWSVSKETGTPVVSNRESGSESDSIEEEQCKSGDILDIENKPNQPNPKSIPFQTLSSRFLHFQERWYKEYPWLHYSPAVKLLLLLLCEGIYCTEKYYVKKS